MGKPSSSAGGVTSVNAYYGGMLDDMRVYDDALTEAEIQKIYQGTT